LPALAAAQYLAGYFFLCSVNADPRQATPLTIARYGYCFSGHEHVRARLTVPRPRISKASPAQPRPAVERALDQWPSSE
jgi:hypothetical protein